MNAFVNFILIVFGILQIILFFKIWGMTNDTEKIRGVFEDTIFCVRSENDEDAIALKVSDVSFIKD